MNSETISTQQFIEALKFIQTKGGIHQFEFWKEMDLSSRKGARIAEFLDQEGFVQRIETTYNGHNTYLILPSVIYPGVLEEHVNTESFGRLSENTLDEISNFYKPKSLAQDDREYEAHFEVFDINASKDGKITIPSQKRQIYVIEEGDIVDIVVDIVDGSTFCALDIVVGNSGQIHIPSRKRDLYNMSGENVNLAILMRNVTVDDIDQ